MFAGKFESCDFSKKKTSQFVFLCTCVIDFFQLSVGYVFAWFNCDCALVKKTANLSNENCQNFISHFKKIILVGIFCANCTENRLARIDGKQQWCRGCFFIRVLTTSWKAVGIFPIFGLSMTKFGDTDNSMLMIFDSIMLQF